MILDRGGVGESGFSEPSILVWHEYRNNPLYPNRHQSLDSWF